MEVGTSHQGHRPEGEGSRAWFSRARAWAARPLVATGLVFGLIACGELPQPPLVVGLNTWVGYDPLVLARDRGLADAQQVKVVELISSAEALRHLRNGLLDAAGLTMDEALRLVDSGFDVRIIAVLDTSAGADVVVAAPRIRNLQALRGERIAVEDATVGTLMLERLLRKARLQREDVTVVRMDATQHLTALQSERVAAAVSYAPMDGPIQAQGYRAIFDSRQLPGEIVDVLVVRADVLRQRPQAVDALLRAWAAGLDAMQQDPAGAAASLAPGADLSPAQYQAVQRGLRHYTPAQSQDLLIGEEPLLAQQGKDMALLLQELGLLRAAPDWATLIDAGPAMRVSTSPPSP
ncbi:ABC transporter substrate-binding protein [Hydrogenophaga sp. 2FB]|uniref:ABC transporter substrate-binding protein n=1 Tax=Hydrogenophaga sp. 2FB TaxID=2502187 RepID=UPI0010F94388|nr:ABC transporter substrate-binding protein [Hydrogenophaga sp. 2FB]